MSGQNTPFLQNHNVSSMPANYRNVTIILKLNK